MQRVRDAYDVSAAAGEREEMAQGWNLTTFSLVLDTEIDVKAREQKTNQYPTRTDVGAKFKVGRAWSCCTKSMPEPTCWNQVQTDFAPRGRLGY